MSKGAKISVIIAVLLGIAISWLLFLRETGTRKSTLENSGAIRQDASPDANPNGLTGPNPFSIPAFAEKIFDGSDFKVGAVLDENDGYTRYSIIYRSAGLTVSGIMNVPKGGGPFPVLFLNHGYISPEVYTTGRGLKREQDYLARNGYVVVHSDYRNHAESGREENPEEPDLRFGYAEDIIGGIEALKKAGLPYADTQKIGMLGHSMGGGVAEIIAVSKPDLVRAIVLFSPVSADQKDNYEKWTKNDPRRSILTIERFGSPSDNPQFWEAASPINYFDRVAIPIMFHHGTDDKDCALEWSQKAVSALEAAGKDATLHIYPGEPHEFTDAWPVVMRRTLEFFDEFVRGG